MSGLAGRGLMHRTGRGGSGAELPVRELRRSAGLGGDRRGGAPRQPLCGFDPTSTPLESRPWRRVPLAMQNEIGYASSTTQSSPNRRSLLPKSTHDLPRPLGELPVNPSSNWTKLYFKIAHHPTA